MLKCSSHGLHFYKKTNQESQDQQPQDQNALMDFEHFEIQMQDYQLYRGELRIIFRIADLDMDNHISQKEYRHFDTLFIKKYQECDQDKNFFIENDEIKDCLISQQFKNLHLDEDSIPKILQGLNKQHSQQIDLADYILMRKVNYVFQKCATTPILPKQELPCGLQIIQGNNKRIVTLQESNQIYKVFELMKTGKQLGMVGTLNVVDFVQVSYLYYYYAEFNVPYVDGVLREQDVIRAIDNQVLPNQLSPYIVKIMFQDSKQIDFMAFATYMYLFNDFMQVCEMRNYTISQDQFKQIVNNPLFPETIRNYLVSFLNPTQEQIDYIADNDQEEEEVTEADYFGSFIQQDHHIFHKNQHSLRKDQPLRHLLPFAFKQFNQEVNDTNDFHSNDYQQQSDQQQSDQQQYVRLNNQQILFNQEVFKSAIYQVIKSRLKKKLQNILRNQLVDLEMFENQQIHKLRLVAEREQEPIKLNYNVQKENDELIRQEIQQNQKSQSLQKQNTEVQDQNINKNKKFRFRKKKREDMDFNLEPNEDQNLEIIFNLFDYQANGWMQFTSYVSLMKMSWSYINFDHDLDQLISIDQLKQGVSVFEPPIKYNDMENHGLFQINDFWLSLQYYKINIKEFFMFFALNNMINIKRSPDLVGHGSYQKVKSALIMLGLKPAEKTLQECNDNGGLEEKYLKMNYNFYKAFRACLKNELDSLSQTYEQHVRNQNEQMLQ